MVRRSKFEGSSVSTGQYDISLRRQLQLTTSLTNHLQCRRGCNPVIAKYLVFMSLYSRNGSKCEDNPDFSWKGELFVFL